MGSLAAPVERLVTGLGFTEGPVWLADHGALLFTDIPRNRILRWRDGDAPGGRGGPAAGGRGGEGGGRMDVWREGSHFAIGLARAADGRVLACEHVTRSLTAMDVEPDGSCGAREVLARAVDGVPLNSTNDVALGADGRILFTDPPFGVREEEGGGLVGYEQAAERPCDVLAVTGDPDAAAVVVTGIHRPNGLCPSPDGVRLYVTDSSRRYHHLAVADLRTGDVDVLWTRPAGVPDGVRLDAEGRIWVAGGDGVYVVSPEGQQVGHVPVPEMVTNLCFGGEDLSTLFITATTSLYRTRTAVPGASAAA